MYDLLSIGTVSIDLYYKGDSFSKVKDTFELTVGDKYFADYFYEGLGGGAANVAIGVEKHGVNTALFAKIGKNPFKKVMLQKLEDAKVTYEHFCLFDENYWNLSSILLTNGGEKTVINYRTPHQRFITEEDDYKKLSRARAIYLANLPNVSLVERFKIMNYAHRNGVFTFLSLGSSDCARPLKELKGLLDKVDALILNGSEFAALVKAPYEDIQWKDNVIDFYIPFMSDQLVIVTDGAKGSYAYHQGNTYRQRAIKANDIVDTTGAGDGYTAGFIAEYLKTKDVVMSMYSGAKYAVKILGKMGAN